MIDTCVAIARLNTLVGEIVDLRHAASLVGWDERVSMPPGGVTAHGAYWNAKIEEHLGIVPDSDANGILQDMHWSIGLFGYFAAYTLGNLISVQLWDQYTQDDPKWASRIHTGEFGTLRAWFRDALHQHGRSYSPRDLVMRIIGQPISTDPNLGYLESKYGELYGPSSGARV